MARFLSLISDIPPPVRILDVGGTVEFWEHLAEVGDGRLDVVVGNVRTFPSALPNIRSVVLDATDLSSFGQGSFDVVFSNSVIEHLFTFERQERMAAEVRRVSKRYWVQTPNFWFPVEPHFLFPGWQWLPEWLRIAILRRFRCGWRGPCPDPEQARAQVREVRLLTPTELRRIFPGARLFRETFYGMTKSLVAYDGFFKAP